MLSILFHKCRGHPLVGVIDWFIREKRRSLYLLPSYHLRLLALPNLSRTATQRPYACICYQRFRHSFSRSCVPKTVIYIPTGIYRCSILDLDLKLCENFRWSRISADKRFLIMSADPPAYPDRGLCKAVCVGKVTTIIRNEQIVISNFFLGRGN